jgi:hypothetical protein
MREKMRLNSITGRRNITLCKYFRKWNWRFVDALIDAFPIKPEQQEEIALPRFAVVEDQCWKIKFYQCISGKIDILLLISLVLPVILIQI